VNARLRLSNAFADDLEDIWGFIGVDSPLHADAFIRRLMQTCERLAERPGIGRDRSEFGKGYRSFVEGDFIVLCRPFSDGIEVMRVIHGARDIRPALDN
jgi:toxin ParE1/3/4